MPCSICRVFLQQQVWTHTLKADMGCSCFGGTFISSKNLRYSDEGSSGFLAEKNIKFFSYDELKSATDNFSPRNKLGQGGFGIVYKGTLRGGLVVAVKVLSAESRQGVKEFLTEINVITNVRHPNLVELIGCCVEGTTRILVYEYVQNNSLDRALLGSNSDRTKLNWSIRSSICKYIARGLKYLHEELEPPIVHRDIKASNILLGHNFSPKIGDFGLAKLFPHNVTHISTRVAGTTGYLAPEYAMHGQLTKKADVYSFGVLVIEIISGRSSSKAHWLDTEKFLLEWAWELYEEGRLKELVDPSLGRYPEEEVLKFIKVALFCTQAAAARRPDMRQVLEMLSKPVRLNDKELTPPGYVENPTRTISKDTKVATYSINSVNIKFATNPETFTEIMPR